MATCVQNTSESHCFEKKTITIASSQKFDHSSSLVVAGKVVQKIQETAVGSGVAAVPLRHGD